MRRYDLAGRKDVSELHRNTQALLWQLWRLPIDQRFLLSPSRYGPLQLSPSAEIYLALKQIDMPFAA